MFNAGSGGELHIKRNQKIKKKRRSEHYEKEHEKSSSSGTLCSPGCNDADSMWEVKAKVLPEERQN